MSESEPKPKITIDVSDWGLGEWPAELLAALFPNIETVVKKIAREAIESFFGDDLVVDVVPHGIRIIDGSNDPIDIPWRGGALLGASSDLAALREIIALCKDECESRGVAFPPPAELTEEEWRDSF